MIWSIVIAATPQLKSRLRIFLIFWPIFSSVKVLTETSVGMRNLLLPSTIELMHKLYNPFH